MYINKNKGIGILEVMISMCIISFFIIELFIILKTTINLEKKENNLFFQEMKLSRIYLDLEEKIDISKNICILNPLYISSNFHLPRESKDSGSALLIHYNTYEKNKKEEKVVLYFFQMNMLELYHGKILNNEVEIDKEKTERKLKKVKGKFMKNNLLVKLSIDIGGELFEKEF